MKNNVNKLWYATERHIPVLGHRGICAQYPENTLVSFESAIRLGVDLIEFDINVTKDGELVIIHDNDIARTSNGEGLVRSYTLKELKTFDFASKFKGWKQKEEIPTLRELLTMVNTMTKDICLNVEIKDMTEEAVDKTLATLQEFDILDRCVIACFDANILRYTHKKYPDVHLQGFPGCYMEHFTEDVYDMMFGMGIPIHWNDVIGNEDKIKGYVRLAKSHGILPWLFCADTPKDVERCVRYGCANVTGNNPAVALETLRKMNLHK